MLTHQGTARYAYLILRSDQDGQSDCVMREKGYARLKNPILIAGKSYNEDQCTVAMSVTLTLRVQHPSWSYRNGGVQIGVSIDDWGKTQHNSIGARRHDLPFEEATIGDARALFRSVGTKRHTSKRCLRSRTLKRPHHGSDRINPSLRASQLGIFGRTLVS